MLLNNFKGIFPSIKLNSNQKKQVIEFNLNIKNGSYKMTPLACLCGENNSELVLDVDRHNFEVNTMLCRNCGLLRSDPYYDDKTLKSYYTKNYGKLYRGLEKAQINSEYFEAQKNGSICGQQIYDFCSNKLKPNSTVFEIGCSAGYNLDIFKKAGHTVFGCDYGEDYVSYANSVGIEAHCGDYKSLKVHGKADLIILNHVIEHIREPIAFLNAIREELLKEEGLIYIGVPGIMYAGQHYDPLVSIFQNAHCHTYSLDTLQFVTSQAHLALVDGNEFIQSLFKASNKPPLTPDKNNYSKIRHYLKYNNDIFKKINRRKRRAKKYEIISLILFVVCFALLFK